MYIFVQLYAQSCSNGLSFASGLKYGQVAWLLVLTELGLRCRPSLPLCAGACGLRPVTAEVPAQTDVTNRLVVELLAADGLAALPGDARRHCVHYTMSRCGLPGAVQPSQLM